jgi:nucleotide-binding universal stress UspA family protein
MGGFRERNMMRRAATLRHKALATFVTRGEVPFPAETIGWVGTRGAHQFAVGTRGLCSLGNLFLGSVATKVVRVVQVPVTLVK